MQVLSSTSSINTSAKVDRWGGAIALAIFTTWAVSLTTFLSTEIQQWIFLWIFPAIFWQTFLYTGLFITAHDAMHDVVCPSRPRLGHWIGTLALLFYGFLPYQKFLQRHKQHHQYPASEYDPDFHDGKHSALLPWYCRFMWRYWEWKNMIGVTLCYHCIHHLLHVSQFNLVLFWVLPSLLSSFQLFYFGTFLPHREPPGGYASFFRAQSSYRPFWLSLLTCYHFGYHHEHHQHPHVPWWMLPAIAQNTPTSTMIISRCDR